MLIDRPNPVVRLTPDGKSFSAGRIKLLVMESPVARRDVSLIVVSDRPVIDLIAARIRRSKNTMPARLGSEDRGGGAGESTSLPRRDRRSVAEGGGGVGVVVGAAAGLENNVVVGLKIGVVGVKESVTLRRAMKRIVFMLDSVTWSRAKAVCS